MYIPMMKTREEELRVAKDLNYCFSDKIIPLFEILDEKYEKKYETDENGDYILVLKQGQKKRSRVLKESTSDDIVTLENINNIVNKSKVFIDYFRFDIRKYDKQLDIKNMRLAYKLNSNYSEYIKKLVDVSSYPNMIPVISLKNKFTIPKKDIIEIITKLQNLNSSIALRIEDSLYGTYIKIIEENLRENDYLLYDINNQNLLSKVIELEEFKDCKTKAKKILLNSPRDIKNANKDYEECEITNLIDNSVANEYINYKFDGFGDYGGLKDQLPTKGGGGNGKGAALALLYNYSNNSFYSFCNTDTNLGQAGYSKVIKDVLRYEPILNPSNECEAYIKIKYMYSISKSGGWRTWNNIALTRYIHQLYLNI